MRYLCSQPSIGWPTLLVILLAASAHAQETTSPAVDPAVDAIWHVQSLPFAFRGRNVLYSCGAFQKKFEAVLLAVGAHPSIITQTSCKPDVLTDRVEVRVALATPMEATPANIAAATTFDSKRALLARLQNTPLPTRSAIEKFQATYRLVTLEDKTDLHLEPSDCELLIAMRDQLFSKLEVQVHKSMLFCTDAVARPPVLEIRALIRTEDQAEQTGRGEANR